jgi:hypothetical protein
MRIIVRIRQSASSTTNAVSSSHIVRFPTLPNPSVESGRIIDPSCITVRQLQRKKAASMETCCKQGLLHLLLPNAGLGIQSGCADLVHDNLRLLTLSLQYSATSADML